MTLVDARVLIDFLRTKDPKLDHLLRTEPLVICGVARAEVLAGARGARDRQRLLRFLNTFQQIVIPERCWNLVGDNMAALNARGITVPFPDVTIVTLGIENDIEVWARDRHFPAMQTVLPRLKLFQEPP